MMLIFFTKKEGTTNNGSPLSYLNHQLYAYYSS